jgi:hypothetical protein
MRIAVARTAGIASAGTRGTRGIRLLCVSCVLWCAAACSDPVVPPTPTPAVPTILDTFTGTLLQFGTNSHPFSVQQIGGIKISVTSIDPSAAIGIGIGTPSTASGSCLVLSQVTTVSSAGVQISGNATLTGNFCVSVSDVGNLVEPVNYTITVLHT